ncbi:hypothetical protein ACFVQB_14695 [Paenibacillus sp. NPDC057886]|uniref:hypothetical protein n=1 Tax=Paenibacillus sp. NPDC057886 TaxID=3346270 RepID=UPI00368DFC0D
MSMYSQVEICIRVEKDEINDIKSEISKLPCCGHDDISHVDSNTLSAKITLNYGIDKLTEFLLYLEKKTIEDNFTFVGYFSSEERNINKTNLYSFYNHLYLVDCERINGYGYSDTEYKIMDLNYKYKSYFQSDYEQEKDKQFFVEKYIEDSKTL